nr:MAG TPA: hypothetical protein [Caudoviricetes sp.]
MTHLSVNSLFPYHLPPLRIYYYGKWNDDRLDLLSGFKVY